MTDYYELLGIKRDATQAEIKKAFRDQSKTMHPDVGGDEEHFSELNEAYQTLMDEDSRAFYDRTGKGQTQSIDLHAEAENLLIGLFDQTVENTGNLNGMEILDEMYKECRSRIQVRQRDAQFLKRTKEEFEKKLGCIQKDGESETIFDSVLKEKIQKCENEISLAEVDVQTIEIALKMLHEYHPRPEDENTTARSSGNKALNTYAKFLLDNDQGVPLSSFAYGNKDREE